MRVMVISTDKGFRQETRALLEDVVDLLIVEGEASPEILDRILSLQPDLILVDLDGLPSLAADSVIGLGEQHPEINIVVLTAKAQNQAALDALRNGASGHLSKGSDGGDEILAALRAVHRGESFLSPTMAGVVLDEMNYQYHLVRSAR